MPCPDGVRLATRLWRPDPDGPHGVGPWPVLLMRQPYGRAIASTVTYAHPAWYAARGFLVAVQDVRGRGDSEGEFRGFAGEAADGATAVRWARNLENANGRVGTYGFSYQGLTQLLLAKEAEANTEANTEADAQRNGETDHRNDPFPDCLAPAMAGLDERLHWASEGGAHWWGLGIGWALQLAAEGCRRRNDTNGWRQIRRSLESGTFLEEGPALLERMDPTGMGLGWLGRDAADPQAWMCHEVTPDLLRRPMLLVGGWHDPHLRGVLDLWERARAAGGRPGLVIGGWSHLHWQGGIDALQLAFFRRHLQEEDRPAGAALAAQKAAGRSQQSPAASPERPAELPEGLGRALEGGIALEAEGVSGWGNPSAFTAAAGPREGDSSLAWTLCSDGRAAIRPDEGELVPGQGHQAASVPSTDRASEDRVWLVHDPWRPVPARGGHLGPDPGVVDRGDLDSRTDVACFSTAPLPGRLTLLGRPRLEITVQADQPGFDLCVALSLLPAMSRNVRQLSTGFARTLGPQAQEARRRRVDLQPLAVELGSGDRLRLSIAAAAWPAIAVNPGDGSQPWGAAGPNHRVITLTLALQGSLLRIEPLLEPGQRHGILGAN
ncbi:MAG: CocE/NonD family hydrolase [Cyanobacteria bacterium]|nr:CocE/NonD family hydrolase [Cyanobacteriota bacterium]